MKDIDAWLNDVDKYFEFDPVMRRSERIMVFSHAAMTAKRLGRDPFTSRQEENHSIVETGQVVVFGKTLGRLYHSSYNWKALAASRARVSALFKTSSESPSSMAADSPISSNLTSGPSPDMTDATSMRHSSSEPTPTRKRKAGDQDDIRKCIAETSSPSFKRRALHTLDEKTLEEIVAGYFQLINTSDPKDQKASCNFCSAMYVRYYSSESKILIFEFKNWTCSEVRAEASLEQAKMQGSAEASCRVNYCPILLDGCF